MSHNPNPNADTSGFSYASTAGTPATMDQTYVGIMPSANSSITESSSSSVSVTMTHSTLNNHIGSSIDRHQGKLYGEHAHNDGHTATPVATKDHE